MPYFNETLSPREIAVLRLVAQGLSPKMVSNRLNMASRTVHFHFANIKAKLGVHTMEEVMFIAGRENLLGEYRVGDDVESEEGEI
jgi:two-component system, NarL family, response regulator, fimbrial Z protein, FimZ